MILAVDQGTTSTRAIVFSEEGVPVGGAQRELTQMFPAEDRVEHDPEEIWTSTLEVCRGAIADAGVDAKDIACLGITNQRETTLVWDKKTGEPVCNAIVWQDRRTAARCAELREQGHEPRISDQTGLLLDPYFSGTKLEWILDHVEGARRRAERGDLLFGTVDTFLLYRLTGGKVHKTDATNASRTLLFDIAAQQWDSEILDVLDIPDRLLPEVCDCCADFGACDPELLGAPIPITGIAGDQQAALVGQACFRPGMAKSTYGTGCFLVLNTGEELVRSEHRLLSTVAYRIGGEVTFALEGSIFVAGAVVQWLRDGLGLLETAAASEALAERARPESNVYFVPAFTGLGAPYWDPDARGAIFGLTRGTGPAEIAAAALRSVCYRTRDLLEAMTADGAERCGELRVDGGMVENGFLMRFLADVLGARVERPEITETTALGAAYLAGLQRGVFESLDAIAGRWRCETAFAPTMSPAERDRLYDGWRAAVERTRTR